MKGKKILIPVIVILLCCILPAYGHKNRAEKLAEYGKEQFIHKNFPEYLENIQEQGLADLAAEIHSGYSYEYDYDKESKTLQLKCRLTNLASEEIDSYYTSGYNGEAEERLADLMKAIRSAHTGETYTYVQDSQGTVVVRLETPEHEISIKTPSGRSYKIVYDRDRESVRVEIDGDWIYSANEANTDEIVGEVPYVGMSVQHINHTELGFYDEVEYCPDYKALRPDLRSETYIWYGKEGTKIFSAHVFRDEVTSTIDIRNGKIISNGPNDKK